MKNQLFYLTVLFFLVCNMAVHAQQQSSGSEVKFNAPIALVGFLEGTYEYIINDESGVGISAGFAYDDFYFNASVTPFYRFYFGKKRAAGFFVEGSGSLYTQDYDTSMVIDGGRSKDSEMGAGIGIALGFKLLTVKGFVFEGYAGAGRNFMNEDKIDGAYPRVGLNVGKRF